MKTKLKETSQSRLEVRDGILCIVVEKALDGGASKAGSPAMRQRGQITGVTPLPQQFVHVRGVHLKNASNLLNRVLLLVHRLHDALSEFAGIWLHTENLS